MKRTIAAIAVLAILTGCGKHSGRADDSLMTVAGHVLTVEKANAMLSAQLAVTKNPKRARAKLVKSVDRKFKVDCVIHDYARSNGIAIDENELTRRTGKLLSRRRGMAAENVAALEEMVRSELTLREVRKNFFARQNVEIPASEVKKRKEIIERINSRSNATNALVYAQATNCWKRLLSEKINFKEALELYDQTEGVRDQEGEWGEFTLDAFQEEEMQLRSLLATMKPGDITPPVPGDNGLLIVKLLGTGANGNNPNAAGPSKTYRIARIFFHLYETFEPQPDSELEQDLRNIELRDRWGKFLDGLVDAAETRYGNNGSNLKNWKENNRKEIMR